MFFIPSFPNKTKNKREKNGRKKKEIKELNLIFARIPKNLDFDLWLAYNIDIKKNESFVRAAVLP